MKPADPDSPHQMNVHVGLCWSVDVMEEALPLSEGAMVAVNFSISTYDFLHQEEVRG